MKAAALCLVLGMTSSCGKESDVVINNTPPLLAPEPGEELTLCEEEYNLCLAYALQAKPKAQQPKVDNCVREKLKCDKENR